jgi:hypothetical protein
MHVASTHAKDNGKWTVQIDGVESPEYDEVLKTVPFIETVFADNGDLDGDGVQVRCQLCRVRDDALRCADSVALSVGRGPCGGLRARARLVADLISRESPFRMMPRPTRSTR